MIDNPRLPYLKNRVSNLSLEPGVYLMKDKSGEIICREGKILKKTGEQLFPRSGEPQ